MCLGALPMAKNLGSCDIWLFAADTVASGLSCLELTWILVPYKFSTQNLVVSATDLVSCPFVFMLTIRKKSPSKPVCLNPVLIFQGIICKISESLAFPEPWKQLEDFEDLDLIYKFINTKLSIEKSNPEVASSLWWRNAPEIETLW